MTIPLAQYWIAAILKAPTHEDPILNHVFKACNGFLGEGIHIGGRLPLEHTPVCATCQIIQKHHCLGGSARLMVTRVRLRLEAIMVKL